MSDQSQLDEPQEITCVERVETLRLSPEQLRKFLSDRRNAKERERRTLLEVAARMKQEIATIDELLAELTIG